MGANASSPEEAPARKTYTNEQGRVQVTEAAAKIINSGGGDENMPQKLMMWQRNLEAKAQEMESAMRRAYDAGLADGRKDTEVTDLVRELEAKEQALRSRLGSLVGSSDASMEDTKAAEYEALVTEFQQRFGTDAMPLDCQEPAALVHKCYKDNSSKTLLCAELVKAFVNCADDARKVS